MRGSTRKRGNTWTAYWDVLDQAGNRKQRSSGGFATQKAAQRHLTNVLAQLDAGTWTEPNKTPLGRFLIDEWLPAIRGDVAILTYERYRKAVILHVHGHDIAAVSLANVTPGHVQALYVELGDAGLSPATIRLTHAVLRRALNDAIRWRMGLATNPVSAVKPPRLPRTKVTAWTDGELRRFLDRTADHRLHVAFRLAAMTGMRRAEIVGLHWETVYLDEGRLRVEQQLLPTPDGLQFGQPKSRRGIRGIALDPGTVDALRRHRDCQILEQELAGPAYVHLDLVFADEIGRALHPERLSKAFIRARKAAGIPVGSIHCLRHTHATILLTGGVPLHVVAARLGDDPATVLAVYAHLLPHSDKEAADVIAAAVDPVDKALTSATS